MAQYTEEETQGVGLSFGDFTSEERGKYFGGQVLVQPPVEFSCSDTEEQLRNPVKTEICSEAAQNGPTAVPSDSGVEVGQESEQELVHVKTLQAARDHDYTSNKGRSTGTGQRQRSKSPTEKTVQERPHVVFGGESIVEKRETRKSLKGSVVSPESDSFPPLATSGTAATDKQDTEKLRKRRRKRRQRQRSGSISSSSSDNSEGRSPNSSTDRLSKPKAGNQVADKPDISAVAQDPGVESPSRNECSTEEAKQPSEIAAEVKVAPKPMSWAALFKNSPSASPSIVIKPSATPAPKPEVTSVPKAQPSEEPAQILVPVEEDEHASKLAEKIARMKLRSEALHLCPRGLINKANWCYINATLQALLACPMFANLLREIPALKERGPTSTPILDSLVKFAHEFEVLPTAASKPAFRPGTTFEPDYVYRMLSIIKSCLSFKGRQEDAEEFLSCVLNGLHEEFLQLNKLASPVSKGGAHMADQHELEAEDWGDSQENVEGDWEQVGPRNKSTVTRMASFPKSVISEIFGGYLRSSLHQTGVKESANVEPFFDLQLDIQTVSCIEDALKDLVVKEELHGYTCTKTNQQVDVSRRVTLETLPKVLVLHLKRFIYSKTGSQKLQKTIDYPPDLCISKDLLSTNVKNKYTQAQKVYQLFAVIYHHGRMATGGHYTTDLFHPIFGWLRADDGRLKQVPINYVLKPSQGRDAYVLFYRRTDF